MSNYENHDEDYCALNQFIWKKNWMNNYVLRIEDDSTQYKYGIFWFNYDNQKTAIFMYKIYLMIQIK